MIDDLQPLIDRLRTMYDHRGDGIPTQPVNPDGEKAIEAIERLSAENERLRAHIAEQSVHVATRIQDGIEMGAVVWRIALEDIVRENTAALGEHKDQNDG